MLLSCKQNLITSHIISNRTSLFPFLSFLLLSYIHRKYFSSFFVLLKHVSTENFKLPPANVLRRNDCSSLALLQSSDMLKPTAAAIFNLYSKINVRISRTQLDTDPALWELESKKLTDRQCGYITPRITEAARKLWCKLKFHSSLLDCTAGQKGKKELFIYVGQPPAVPSGAGAAPMCPGTQHCSVEPSAAAEQVGGEINNLHKCQ